jgi:phospholipid/cholesterol/gamma-HCH transport system substrate-binding protein
MTTFSRARRFQRRDHPRPRATVIRGTIVVVIAGLLGLQLLRLYNGVPTTNYKTVYVSTPIVGNLLSHDAVRVAGKRIGQVLSTDIGRDGRPRVELQLAPGTKLPADTGVRLRANGLLGARFVELAPGSSRSLLAEGATIRGDANSYTFGLPEAVDVFDRQTRGGLSQVINKLGEGTLGNGTGLNQSVRLAGTRAKDFQQVMDAILARGDAAGRLLPAVRSAIAAFDRGSDVASTFPDAMSDALRPFVSERDATRATLDHAPAALASAQDGLRRGQRLVAQVRRFATVAAKETLPAAPEGFRQLAALLREAIPRLRQANPVLKHLAGGAQGARTTVLQLRPVLPLADKAIPDLRQLLAVVAAHSCDVADTAVALRSMTGFGQSGFGPNGPAMAFRLQAVAPNAGEAVGVTDSTGLLTRVGYEAPCSYLQHAYPQFVPGGISARSSRR